MLRVHELVTAYGKIEALRGVSLEVAQGSITCLLGPNGAGKTTLMMTHRRHAQAQARIDPLSRAKRLSGLAAARDRGPRDRAGAGEPPRVSRA